MGFDGYCDSSTHGAAMAGSDDRAVSVLLEGILEKKARYLKQWKKRFFRLRRGALQIFNIDDEGRQELHPKRTLPLKDITSIELLQSELVVSVASLGCGESTKQQLRLRGDDLDSWRDMLEVARIESIGGARCDWCEDEQAMQVNISGSLPGAGSDPMATAIASDIIDELLVSTGFTLAELRHLFCILDSVCEGCECLLGKPQLACVLQHVVGRAEPCAVAAELLHNAFDTDRSGTVDFRELALGISVLAGHSQDQRIDMLFRSFDLNVDGSIDRGEAEHVIQALFKSGGGVDGVWGGQDRDVAPVPEQEYAMFKNVLDRIFVSSEDADSPVSITRAGFDSCVRDFNRMIPNGALPTSKELAAWRHNVANHCSHDNDGSQRDSEEPKQGCILM